MTATLARDTSSKLPRIGIPKKYLNMTSRAVKSIIQVSTVPAIIFVVLFNRETKATNFISLPPYLALSSS